MLTLENRLTSSIVTINELSETDKNRMYLLYDAYYASSDRSTFWSDLSHKNYVILLRDTVGIIQGFSTLALYDENYEGAPIRVIYSGDTIIDKAYWGQNPFAKTWLQFAGYLTTQSPNIPLYWLLIVKGHRTYRYLPLFSKEYYPHFETPMPEEAQELLHFLAKRKFGSAYNETDGLVYFPEPRSYLTPELAEIPEKDINRPEVQFFLSKNPNYAKGDELVCLCKLSPSNLTRFARKWFLEGAQLKAS